jgi:excinuclease ABC subunit A
MQEKIVIRGAREHNLKNITIELPRDKLIVITGLSGSGKSTLAFDTLYAEGQRRYVESLSAYARQFLGQMHKPDVDSIDGLSPAISIEQKTTSRNPRSTVGTVTEVYDYLRLLYARIGVPYCPNDGTRIEPQSADQITNQLLDLYKGKKVQICAPVIQQKKGTYEKLVEDAKKDGFARVRVDGKTYSTDEKIVLAKYEKHDIDLVIDRLVIGERQRLQDAVEQALKRAEGYVRVIFGDEKNETIELYSSHAACPKCGLNFEELQPRMFSFNSPFGACEECHGLGFKQEFDEELIVPDQTISIADGALAVYKGYGDGWRVQQVGAVAKASGFDMFTPWKSLSKKHRDIVLHGTRKEIKFKYTSRDGGASFSSTGEWEGVIPQLQRLYKQTESDGRRTDLERFMRHAHCPGCDGKRLKPKVLAVKVHGKNIIELTDLAVRESSAFFLTVKLTAREEQIARLVLKEINERLKFLLDVGLGYLTLSRSADTLSGGEAQRIRLATQIGSNLTGVMYVLDEPSIGLHQRDNERLIKTLTHLRDLGNTLIVVEHDEDTIRAADYVVDIGPGAGIHGGHIVAQGTPAQVMANPNSLTGKYLTGKETIPTPTLRRKPTSELVIKGASEHNLQTIDVNIPLGVFVAITGVSGSGKSTLISDILHPALMQRFYKSRAKPGAHKAITIPKDVHDVIVIDQDPIGRTPRSNPATYTKVFDDVRKLFAATKEAKVRGYKEGRFSFNVAGGRCETCSGDGVLRIEMNFLPDVYIECEECKGKRYNQETLQVLYKGKTIADVLDMTVDEALEVFTDVPSLHRKLTMLADVGLTYVKLGQSSTTLSGGESQRIKITRELAKRKEGHILYILDEPTTGLHFHDVKKLLTVLNRLVEKDNTVLAIEHNLDVIKTADWIIDLGPEGGDQGGTIVAQGTPEQVANVKGSYTGQFLARAFGSGSAAKPALKKKRANQQARPERI